jgi:dihydroxy-acid dehydratase
MIDIDIAARSLSVRLSDVEIAQRLAELPPYEPSTESSWLRRYARFVTSASTGAILI